MKFYFSEYLVNFNICPSSNENDRPLIYDYMIKSFKKFSEIFKKWCDLENPKRKTMFEKKLRDKNKIYKPLDGKFLNNLSILKSKFIYDIFFKK